MDSAIPEDQDDPYIGFGSAEVAYILAQFPSNARAARVADVLGIDPHEVDEIVLAAGASSLLARGLLFLEDDTLVTRDSASVLSSAVSSANAVVGIGFMIADDRFSDGLVLLQSREFSLLLQPRALGTWFALVRAPTISDGEALSIMAHAFREEHAEGQILITSGDLAFLLTPDDAGWNISPDIAAVEQYIRDEELSGVLSSLIALTAAHESD